MLATPFLLREKVAFFRESCIMVPIWNQGAPMPVTLSIKSVPDELLKRLRRRAVDHHRSLQGELMAIIEQSVLSEKQLTVEEVIARVRRLGLRTPRESTRMIRMDRNAR